MLQEFGYQTQKCSVIRLGCQKLNLAHVCGLVGLHIDGDDAATNVPST